MKLIYVKIPVISEYTKAYIVSGEEDLYNKLIKDQIVFEKQAKWYEKPEKTKNGKELMYHELNRYY